MKHEDPMLHDCAFNDDIPIDELDIQMEYERYLDGLTEEEWLRKFGLI